MIRIVFIALSFLALHVPRTAQAEYQWSWSVACPESGGTSPDAAFTASNDRGFSGSGTCKRVPSGFSRFTFTSSAGTPFANIFFGTHTGDMLLLPPTWGYDRKPIVALNTSCPTRDQTLNWIVSHWDQAFSDDLLTYPILGSSTYSMASGLRVDEGYAIDGAMQFSSPVTLGGSCSSGTLSLSGEGDRKGTIQITQVGTGVYSTSAKKKFLFLPEQTIDLADDVGSLVFRGFSFNSSEVASTKIIQATASSDGSVWTIQSLSNATTGALSGSYTDTITIASVNSPRDGMLLGSLTRTGAGAGTGGVACIFKKGLFLRIFCSAESPENNAIPYSFVLSNEGPHILGRQSGTSVSDQTSLYTPESVATDGTRILVADTLNHRVLIWNSFPTENHATASLVLGQPNLEATTANNGGRSASTLSTPRGVWTDGTRVLVADTNNNRVLIWNSFPTSNGQAADVVVGQSTFTGGGGAITATGMRLPFAAHFDGTKLYVADYNNNRVLIYNSLPTTNGATANVVLGQANFTSSTENSGGIGGASMNFPAAVRTVGSKLLVSDTGNSRLLVWNSIPTTNQAAANFALGQPNLTSNTLNNGGRSATTLANPREIYSDGTKLLVADRTNNRLLIWNSFPTASGTAADLVVGQTSFALAAVTPRGPQTLYTPRGVAFGGDKLLVTDAANHRVLIYDGFPTSNTPSASIAIGQPSMITYAANINTLSEYSFSTPNGVHFDGTRFFAADTGNNRVLIWNSLPKNNFVPADVVLGQSDFYTNAANSGGIGAGSLSSPTGVFSTGTKLLIADSANNRVLIWNTIPTSHMTSADVVLGQSVFTSAAANSGGRSAQSLYNPESVFVFGGKLYVADRTNHRVLIWNSIPTVSQTAANLVIGQADFASGTANSGGVSAQTLSNPRDAQFDGTNFYVVDGSNNRVLIWNSAPSSNGEAADVVVGQPDMTSATANNGGIGARSLFNPRGMGISGSRLMISDGNNHRILIWNTVPTTDYQAADAVFGQSNFTGDTANSGGLASNRVYSPRLICALSSLAFVADSSNSRILAFEPP